MMSWIIFFTMLTIVLFLLIALFLIARSQFHLPANAETLIDEVIATPNETLM